MPLQFMVTADAVSRTSRYSNKAQDVAFNPVGQVVGQLEEIRPVRDVVLRMVEEYVDSIERLNALSPE